MRKVDHHTEISGEDARQGYIALNTPLRRAIFVGGLVGLGALVVGLAILGG